MTDASCRGARKNNGRTLKHEPRKRDKVSRKNGAAEKMRGGHTSFKKGNPEIQAMATVWRGEGSICKLQVMSCGEKAIAISGVKSKTPSKRSRHKSDKWESNKESIKTGSPRKQR